MDTKLSKNELNILVKADNEIFERGYTEQKCPRCRNDIICEENGNSYTICCKSKGCIKTEFRGI